MLFLFIACSPNPFDVPTGTVNNPSNEWGLVSNSDSFEFSEEELFVFDDINLIRGNIGLEPLEPEPRIGALARYHSERMAFGDTARTFRFFKVGLRPCMERLRSLVLQKMSPPTIHLKKPSMHGLIRMDMRTIFSAITISVEWGSLKMMMVSCISPRFCAWGCPEFLSRLANTI